MHFCDKCLVNSGKNKAPKFVSLGSPRISSSGFQQNSLKTPNPSPFWQKLKPQNSSHLVPLESLHIVSIRTHWRPQILVHSGENWAPKFVTLGFPRISSSCFHHSLLNTEAEDPKSGTILARIGPQNSLHLTPLGSFHLAFTTTFSFISVKYSPQSLQFFDIFICLFHTSFLSSHASF